MQRIAIVSPTHSFGHYEACRIFDQLLGARGERRFVLDMSRAENATTSAFARLVLLRRKLRREGGDLHLTGLRDRAARVYEVSRLQAVLPRL